jgi:chemotaxis regulatin CheY-phosphate phosphatase CheZ
MRNTAENVRAVVDAMNAANPAADAVEEAARALLRRLDGFVYGDSPHYDLPETDALHEALLAAERAAALRREKGGA